MLTSSGLGEPNSICEFILDWYIWIFNLAWSHWSKMSILMHLIHSNLLCLSNSQINSQKLQPATMASGENKNQQLIKTGLLFGNLSHYEPGNPEWSSVLIRASTRGRQSSRNINLLSEVIYFCVLLFFCCFFFPYMHHSNNLAVLFSLCLSTENSHTQKVCCWHLAPRCR